MRLATDGLDQSLFAPGRRHFDCCNGPFETQNWRARAGTGEVRVSRLEVPRPPPQGNRDEQD